jgi:hypothetical protein
MARQYVSVNASGALGLKTITSWNVRETSLAAPAIINIRDGGAAGTIILSVRMSSGESVGDSLEDAWKSTSLYFELVSGAATFNAAGSVE